MYLYYVYDVDDFYRLVVRSNSKWHARYKASEYIREEYDDDIPIYNWNTELCRNDIVIE